MENTLLNVQHERKNLREWAIFNAYNNKFYNLDYVPTNEIELPTIMQKRLSEQMKQITDNQTQGKETKKQTLLVDDLPLGYTFVECEKYLAHIGNDKKFCSIVNTKEPLYLLNIQIKLIKHEVQPIINKHNQQLREQEAARQKAEQTRLEYERLQKGKKDKFKNDLKNWAEKGVVASRQGISTEDQEKYYSEKPTVIDYGLTREDFTTSELQKLASDYNIHF